MNFRRLFGQCSEGPGRVSISSQWPETHVERSIQILRPFVMSNVLEHDSLQAVEH